MVDALAARSAEKDWGMYLLGAQPGAAKRLAEVLLKRYPRLTLSTSDGYFSRAEEAERVQAIRESGARVTEATLDNHRAELKQARSQFASALKMQWLAEATQTQVR